MKVFVSASLQASEQDVLKYVVKWGEHQLIRRMADRGDRNACTHTHSHTLYVLRSNLCIISVMCVCVSEPNLLSGTAHSVNKRGVKRRDLDLEELKEILSPLLPCVRTEHILPTNSEVLSDTVSGTA